MIKRIRKIPPVCLCIAIAKLLRGSIKLDKEYLEATVKNEDESSFRVFRNIKTQRQIKSPDSCVFVVSFKFAHLSHEANKVASLIPMLLIAGFPGFTQKMYAENDKNGYWQGIYEWKSKKDLEAYKKSFVFLMMKKRAIAKSIQTKEYENQKLSDFVVDDTKSSQINNYGKEKTESFQIIFDKKNNLIQCEAKDSLNVSDFLNLMDSLVKFSRELSNIRILLDLRETQVSYEINQQHEVVQSLKKLLYLFNTIHIADIVNKPKETSYAILFKIKVSGFTNLRFEVFSSKTAALDWLNNN